MRARRHSLFAFVFTAIIAGGFAAGTAWAVDFNFGAGQNDHKDKHAKKDDKNKDAEKDKGSPFFRDKKGGDRDEHGNATDDKSKGDDTAREPGEDRHDEHRGERHDDHWSPDISIGPDEPPPPISAGVPGESLNGECKFRRYGGWFQPVQGVYQDDPIFPSATYDATRVPKPNPLIETNGVANYLAKLPMVEGRDTILMGVEEYRHNGAIVKAGDHGTIVIKGIGNCLRSIGVKIRFELKDNAGTRTLFTTPVIGFAPLEGPAAPGGEMPFTVNYEAFHGVPPQSVGPFTVKGSYFLTAELLRENNSRTGIWVSVAGPAVRTLPPSVVFVPVVLRSGMSKTELTELHVYAQDLAEASHKYIPDYYPLVPEGLPTYVHEPLDLSYRINQSWWETAAFIADEVGTAGVMGGAGRVVVILSGIGGSNSDYYHVTPSITPSAGVAQSTKVVFVQAGMGPIDPDGYMHTYQPVYLPYGHGSSGGTTSIGDTSDLKVTSDLVDTVAHELAHTMPDLVWSGAVDERHNMLHSCGIAYHNRDEQRAYGERITTGSIATERRREDARHPIMGPGTKQETWMTQCTYAHLIESMLVRPDPELLLVRAILSRKGKTNSAVMKPVYNMSGTTDVREGKTKTWAVRLSDAKGRVLATYPFDPHWYTEENVTRDMVSVVLEVPAVAGAAAVDIAFAGKVMAKIDLSQPPSLVITSPEDKSKADRSNTAHVTWNASSASGKPLLASVLYSDNGGTFFADQVFEKPVNEADVKLNPKAKKHMIKVVVTDGGGSSERVITIRKR